MMVAIESIEKNEFGKYISASCGKKEAHIILYNDGSVNVVCKNASHKVWKSCGRMFDCVEDAINGYKSSEMKAMIRMVSEEYNS